MNNNVKVRGQYIKDFSFENPNAPRIFLDASKVSPNINIYVNVSSSKMSSTDKDQQTKTYEVMLHINAEATVEKVKAFICEVKYCGIFDIEDIDITEEGLKEILLIYCPTLLFPFVREFISRITSNAGFPPLLFDIINFKEIYDKHQSDEKEA